MNRICQIQLLLKFKDQFFLKTYIRKFKKYDLKCHIIDFC